MKYIACLLMLLLAACGGKVPPIQSSASLVVVKDAALPPPALGQVAMGPRPYSIGPLDKLRIDVFGIEELKERILQVDSNGNIAFPIAGSVRAAGLTPAQLQETLRERLRAGYIRNPIVTVNLDEVQSQFVTVDGEVVEPGIYPTLAGMTLMRAVASAKGVSEYAELEDVVVFRSIDGARYAGLYNLQAIRRGLYPDPEIYPNDLVVVGDSPGRRLFDNILKASGLITTPIIAVVQSGGF